jgi:hypothetical protein
MFEKGNTFGKGRPKNSQNKTTSKIKEYLQSIAEHIEGDLMSDIDCLSPSERIKLWLSLQEFLIPKLSRHQVQDSDSDININISYPEENIPDYSKLTTEELKTLEKLIAKTY